MLILFQSVRNLGTAYLGPLFWVSQVCHHDVCPASRSSGCLTGEKSPKLIQVLGNIQVLLTGEYKASVPCWHLSQGHSWLLKAAHRSLSCVFLNMAAYFIKPARRISRDSLIMWYNVIIKVTVHHLCHITVMSHTFAIFYWLEESHTPHPPWRGLSKAGHEFQKVGIVGVTEGLCTT